MTDLQKLLSEVRSGNLSIERAESEIGKVVISDLAHTRVG